MGVGRAVKKDIYDTEARVQKHPEACWTDFEGNEIVIWMALGKAVKKDNYATEALVQKHPKES